MLISTSKGTLYLVHDWCIIKEIQESNPKNKKKFYLMPLPHFDEYKFPFIAFSGSKTMNLINVRDKDARVEPLIINANLPG